MSVEDKINVIRQMVRRYMLKTEFQSTSRKIDNERPVKVSIFGNLSNRFWQSIVGVSQNENMRGVLRFLRRSHSVRRYFYKLLRAPRFGCMFGCPR